MLLQHYSIKQLVCLDNSLDLATYQVDRLSGAVHTRVEVHRMDLEMSGLVEQPWLQLMCCAICLPHGRNFRWRRGSLSGSECWMVCHRWTLEIEFNKRLSSSIIRLANYSITTSFIFIGDAWGFSGKTPIAPSRGFSVETLTGVTPSWKTELNRSISAMEDRISGGL